MSAAPTSQAKDLLVRAIAPTDELRIAAAITTEVVREAQRRHQLTPAATVAMGRALTSGLLLATMTKGEERVTLQVVGDGPLGNIVADANAHGDVRGYVKNPRVEGTLGTRPQLEPLVGRHGILNVTRDLGMRDLYQGQVELVTGEIDEDVEAYLRVSEQVPSALSCEVLLDGDGNVVRAGGILVQALPGGQADAITRAQHRLRTGALHVLLMGGDVSARDIAAGLSPSHPVEVLGEDRPVRFQCQCSDERIRATLQLLSASDLDEMIAEGKPAEVTCNFCNQHYEVPVTELGELRSAMKTSLETN
ncbi:MAG: Hsp33 family molecular chaperone HslO [Polyangia bacterium]